MSNRDHDLRVATARAARLSAQAQHDITDRALQRELAQAREDITVLGAIAELERRFTKRPISQAGRVRIADAVLSGDK